MPTLPRVLLLGDSIRMSYQPRVARLLEGEAEVVGPADNCQYSLFTLSSLDRWLGALGQPDIVHWNNGLHDVGHNPNRSPTQIPLAMFRANLEFILKRLRTITPRVIWATITPVHPLRPFQSTGWSWRNEEIDSYNQAARDVMDTNHVPVNDLHALVWPNLEPFLSEDRLHLSEAGQTACAQAVAQAVRGQLPST
ncbi:MAG: SGNH/GDSL hydrolase family protein [Lentisphaerae bacterium]|nr:SGNH/GDSL hydrolase family protein [Lentisphaerota bacterium]